MSGPLCHCRVVLVRPQIAGNLGATARVMRNMGLTDLVLVAEIAGHKRLETTRRYSLPCIEDCEQAMEGLRVNY